MTLDELRVLARAKLLGAGLAPGHAEAVAETMVAGERDGCTSHGIYRLLVAVSSIQKGVVVPDAEPVLSHPARALVPRRWRRRLCAAGLSDRQARADRKGQGQRHRCAGAQQCRAFRRALARGRGAGRGRAGGAGLYAQPCLGCTLGRGRAGIRDQSDRLRLAAPGRAALRVRLRDVHGCARRDRTSSSSRQERTRRLGVDSDGRPTTDPAAILSGAMRTFGGHKGSALAAMVELLAGR